MLERISVRSSLLRPVCLYPAPCLPIGVRAISAQPGKLSHIARAWSPSISGHTHDRHASVQTRREKPHKINGRDDDND